ncbi:hypothetical protein L6164_032560 [Bauhinia variegata]|uniref:Uncharacterized protein n=1 Tax=Bauhinia variegata TaxID=167791 RepID=A0ACB9KP76_BAUVA|nr:hypothetical protein L6164_032560 [Bauhinia variegata]
MSNIFADTTNPNPNMSFEVTQPPNDSISSLSFSPRANFLVPTSWDNQESCMRSRRSSWLGFKSQDVPASILGSGHVRVMHGYFNVHGDGGMYIAAIALLLIYT